MTLPRGLVEKIHFSEVHWCIDGLRVCLDWAPTQQCKATLGLVVERAESTHKHRKWPCPSATFTMLVEYSCNSVRRAAQRIGRSNGVFYQDFLAADNDRLVSGNAVKSTCGARRTDRTFSAKNISDRLLAKSRSVSGSGISCADFRGRPSFAVMPGQLDPEAASADCETKNAVPCCNSASLYNAVTSDDTKSFVATILARMPRAVRRLHLLDRSSGCRLEGDETLLLRRRLLLLLLGGVGGLHGRRRGVLDVLLLLLRAGTPTCFTQHGN